MISFRNLIKIIILVTSLSNLYLIDAQFTPPDILRRFEYKLSLKGPHLVFKDGTIPFWEHGGSKLNKEFNFHCK